MKKQPPVTNCQSVTMMGRICEGTELGEKHVNRYCIKIGGKDVRVTEWGESGNPVVFCLHGLGSTSLSFIEIAEGLEDDFHVFAVDAPGHGQTDPFDREEDYEMPEMVEWVDRVVDSLHIERFYFLSHSWGSFVALFYVKNYRDKVIGSMLLDGGYQSKRESMQSMDEEAAFYEVDFEDCVDTWEEFKAHAVYGSVSRRSAALDRAAEDLVWKKDGKYYWHARGYTGSSIIKAMHKHEVVDFYHELPSSILLLRATLPHNREEERKRMAGIFKESTNGIVKEIPESTHMLHWDQPEYILSIIKQNWKVIKEGN